MLEETKGRSVSIRDVLFIFFKRLKMMIVVFIITLATVIIGILLSTPIYKSSTKVIINRQVSEAVLKMAPWVPLTRSFDLEEEINSEIELITSRAVAESVVERLDRSNQVSENEGSLTDEVSEVPNRAANSAEERLKKIKAIQGGIIAEPVKRSDVIQISYQSPDPQLARDVVNATAESYIDYRTKVYRASGEVAFFDDQIEIAKQNLDQLESALKDYRQQEALLSYDKQQAILLNKLNEFETSLTEVKKDIISTESKLAKVREYWSSPLQPLIPSLEIREEPVIAEMHKRLISLRLQLAELLTKYTEDHQEIRNLREEIAYAEADLKNEVERVIDLQETSLSALRAEEQALNSTVNMLYTEVKSLPEKELTISRLQRAIGNHQEVYSMLMLKREEARVTQASDRRISNVSIISPATLPFRPVKPQKGLLIFVGCLIGLIGGLGSAFVLEYIDHSLKTRDDVEHYLHLPVLASIPEQKYFSFSGR
jgi:succinoglycan biosynthesis transport protein ExoP